MHTLRTGALKLCFLVLSFTREAHGLLLLALDYINLPFFSLESGFRQAMEIPLTVLSIYQ